ncbi:amidase [Bacillus horti]|uniref:Fatty acid amide hydrolase 2 n=1 Tax=Caldalkalibacillus horti TaxID=77523 RepID=A0ABT9VY61_9BACI|nr:amidase [Bacillus horti]MDQ0165916.1 fatty acid amide hydrolase 2 [Bacillus horti]
MSSILDMDASTLAEKIKKREITSLEATETFIQHLKRINSTINCLVQERFTEAIEEAKTCDQLVAEGKVTGRLFGVPISMKESFDVSGMSTTGGLQHRQKLKSTKDAEAVSRLKQEGAIILGKTNTPTLCFCQESVNKLYGRTNNPWDVSRTAGGSSGGEGALMAVGGAAVGLGSDIGGSIRFPAHFNGVVGFKSGEYQVSQDGHFPFVEDPYQVAMLGMGAIAKSVRDAQLINDIIAERPPVTLSLEEIEKFELIIPEPHPAYPMSAETTDLLKEIRTYFEQKQKVIGEEYPSSFTHLALMWQLIESVDGGQSIADLAFEGRKSSPVREYIKEVTSGKAELHRYLSWAVIGASIFKPNEKQHKQLSSDVKQAKEEIKSFLHNRILIIPVYHTATLPHGKLYSEIFSIRKTFRQYLPYIALPNVLGLPSLTVPVGEDQMGLPISVQLVSLVGNENALFHFGQKLTDRFRGYVRCTAHD